MPCTGIMVGVLYDWENEAVWAAMSVTGRESFRLKPVEARVGVSRALINGNVPFEYVTPADIRAGLAPRYPVIYLPAMLALQTDLFGRLAEYVAQGGRWRNHTDFNSMTLAPFFSSARTVRRPRAMTRCRASIAPNFVR
jgi:beta-galactosidase GanA